MQTLLGVLTLVDTGSRPALPLWDLDVPVVREVILGFNFAYGRLIILCCSRGIAELDLEAHRVVLKGRDGRKAVVGMGMKLNSSFDVAEWGGMDGIRGTPVQVIWSNDWSKEWIEEGKRVAEALPHAKFVTHSGGRWPQALLHFIYWDSLPDLEELTGLNTTWASTLMSQYLLAAADRYGLERRRLLCEANLCEDVAINTVATTLALAEEHHYYQLKAVCLKFI